jgi:hypothetical protein
MALTAYPDQFPSEAAGIIIRAIRDGSGQIDVVARSAWELQGFAMGQIIGPGITLQPGVQQGALTAPITRNELANRLETLMQGGDGDAPAVSQEEAIQAFEWRAFIIALLDFVRSILS